MMMKYAKLAAILAILIAVFAACSQNEVSNSAAEGQTDSSSAKKLNVVATTGQIHDALINIGGDAINLTGLLGPGVDPHLYVPTESDVTTFGEADVIFYNGLHLEAQMARVLEQMATRDITVVAVGEVLPPEQLLNWDSSAPHDPHVWNDPLLWSLGVEAIRDTLITVDPDHTDLYRRNADAYLATIADTHEYIQAQVDSIPAERRVLITAHDAFGYFARTYGFEVQGLQGISTESESSTADVQELAEFIVERRVPAIFVETSVSPRNIEAVQAAVEARGFEVRIGGALFSDALGDAGTPSGTYTGMLRHNIDTLAAALGDNLADVSDK
jgi:manganese/zinc/iron transport system substrate-binding protein